MYEYFLSILGGYILGCFQTSYILGKILENRDIRNFGSGNAGTTNAFRVFGKKIGVLTFVGDFSKGFLGFYLATAFFSDVKIGFLTAFFVVIGHNWPFLLKFKGGKGIASTLGLIFAYDYRIGFILFGITLLVGYTFNYVSLSSMILTAMFPIYLIIAKEDIFIIVLGILLCLIAIYRHKANIKRIMEGNEARIFSRKNKGKD